MISERQEQIIRHRMFEVRQALLTLYGQEDFFYSDYCCACAVASYMLQISCRLDGIHLQFKLAPDHAWTELNGIVYDPTYSQYNPCVPIYIGPPTGCHQNQYSLNEIRNWPIDQNPFSVYHRDTLSNWRKSINPIVLDNSSD